jgi:type I restriction enzyme M protein
LVQLRRVGSDELKAKSLELIRQVDAQIAKLDPKNKDEKKKITPLNKIELHLRAG